MKLAIYGDSWADASSSRSQDPQAHCKGWPELLRPHFDQLDNYARASSSLYFSYDNFVRTNSAYDHIIFVATSIGRWTKTIMVDGLEKSAHSYGACEYLLKHSPISHKLSLENRQLLEHVKNYFMYVQDMNYESAMHDLMLSDILRRRPDSIIVSIAPRDNVPGPFMSDFLDLFVESCWPGRDDLKNHGKNKYRWEEKELICHLSPEINQLVSQAMLESIKLGRWHCQLPSTVHHEFSGDHYVTLQQ